MLPIFDIITRSISGYVFIIPFCILYFLYLDKTGRKQSIPHIIAVLVFCYYFFGILTVTGIGYTKTIAFHPNISLIPIVGMITGPIDTILNIILDILFVAFINKDVSSVAYATVIAQGISALSMVVYCLKTKKDYIPKKQHIHYDSIILNKFLNFSLLTCLQQSVMNFGIMMVSGLVNSFGVSVMAGFNTAVKIDTIAYMPSQDFGNAFSTFVAQNTGASKYDRVEKGLKTSMLMSTLFNIFMSFIIFVFAKNFMLLFVDAAELEVVRIGAEYLRIEGACYIGIGILFLWYGYYRGIGEAHMSVVLTVISLGTRVILAYILSHYIGVVGIWVSIPIGWFLADITGLIYHIKKKSTLVNV